MNRKALRKIPGQGWPGIYLMIFLLLQLQPLFASQWSVSTGLQWQQGSYIYQEPLTVWRIYGGLRWDLSRATLAVQVPYLMQNTAAVQQFGPVVGPRHKDDFPGSPPAGGHQHGNVGMVRQSFQAGLGDIFLSGEFRIWQSLFSQLVVQGVTKVPTASASAGLGTGEWDVGLGMVYRYFPGSWSLFASLAGWALGDPETQPLKDTIAYGLGIGRFFAPRYSVMVSFQGTGTIVPGVAPARWLGFQYGVSLRGNTALSVLLTRGLSEATPDWTFGLNLDWKL